MLTLFEEGGPPMWFLLIFSGLMLTCAARFARRPDSSRLRLTGALGLTTLFTTFTAVCADLAAVGHHLPEYLQSHPAESFSTALLQGMAESMSPAIVGFTTISLATLLLALGFQRDAPTA